MDSIKRTKQEHPHTTFTNIFLAGFLKSLKTYLNKKNLNVPEEINIFSPHLYSFENYLRSEVLSNRSFGEMIKTPLKNLRELNIPKPFMFYDARKCKNCSLFLPPKFQVMLLDFIPRLALFSNLPSPKLSIRFDNFTISNVIFYSIYSGEPFFSTGLISFDNKIQLGILSDTSKVQSNDDLEDVLIETVNKIKLLSLKK